MVRRYRNRENIIDIENKNFKMYKANKHWVFASAVMLSLLGTGMVSTSNAKADTVNDTVQTTAIQKNSTKQEATTASSAPESAATKEATPASSSSTSSTPSSATSAVTESKAETASTATSVSNNTQKQDSQAPSSAAKTQATSASSSATKANSSASTSGEKTKSSVASSASSPAKNTSAKSDATSSATTSSNATSSATNSASSSNASTNPSSAASSSATVDADGINPAQNDNQNKDLNDNAAKAAIDNQNNQQDQDIDTTKKKTDTDKQSNIQKQANKSGNVKAGIDVLANGTLEIDGSAINGLRINDDGTYSGHLIFTYNGDSLSLQAFENSQISIQIPKQLRDLFNKMKADNSFYEFIQGHFHFSTSVYQDNYDYVAKDYSFDGENLMVKNPSESALGWKNYQITFDLDLGGAVNTYHETIDDASNNYPFEAILTEPTSIIDWNDVSDYAASASLQTNQLMPKKDELPAPYVDQPIYDDDNTISGTAEPGAHIDITVGGKTIASGKANSDGSFQFKITPQTAGTIIEVTQTVDGVESKGTDVVVQPTPVVVAPPTIDQPFTGDNTVSGSGIAGDTIIIYNDNHDPIGRGTVDANGKYIVDLEPGYTLYNGEVIYATQIDQQGRRSDEVSKRVQDQVASPVINPAKAGDRKVSGTGVYGDTIKLYNNDTGNLIGTTTVRADGTWSVSLPADLNLIDGEELSAIQIDTKGNQSKPTYRVVTGAVEAPQINQPTAGDRVVSGTGVAGDTVTAYFDDGSLIGSAIVNSDGTWTISVPSHAQLIEGTGIYAVQADQDGNQSSQTHTTVLPKAEVATPEITAPTEGDRTISGKGTAGDTVTVYFDDGTEIGSAVVSANGTWTVNVSSHSDLTAGDHIYAVQSDQDGNQSNQANTTVLPKAEVATPEITAPTEGDRTISGKGTAGDTVTVYFDDGTKIGSAVVGSDGKWTVNVSSHSDLTAGDHIYAVQTDQDGNASDKANTTVLPKAEVATPEITTPTEGDRTISGKGTAGDTVTVYFDDGSVIGSAVVGSDGKWTVNVSSHANLIAGDHIYAVQSDQDGNTSDKTNTTVLPKAEVATPKITAPTEGDRTISGKGTAGDTVTVYFDDGTKIGSAVVGSNGTWTVNVSSHANLTAGDNIYAVQSDQDGNTSDKANTTVLPKAEVATPEITAPTEGDRTISGKGTAGDTVTVHFSDGSVIGSAVVGADGTWTINVPSHSSLNTGDDIYAVQTDQDGNESDQAHATVKAREVASPTIKTPIEGDRTISGKGTAGDTVTVYFDDGTKIGSAVVDADGNWTVNVSSHEQLNVNDHIYAVQTDQDGNTSDKTNSTVLPRSEVAKPEITTPTAGDRTISGKGTAGDTITVHFDDGSVIGSAVVDADGNWTVEVSDHTDLRGGDNIYAVQTDQDGNHSDKANTTVIANEVPMPEITAPTAGSTAITGTGVAGDIVTVYADDGTEIGTTVVNSNGTWTVNVPGGMRLDEGDTISAIQTDQDGNQSDRASITVLPVEVPAPGINQPTAGATTITGTGVAGDTVNVYFDDGSLIGSAVVGEDGTWTINVSSHTSLNGNDNIYAVQTDQAGNQSEKNKTTVIPAEVPAPGINQPTAGATTITGTGVAGDTVTVYGNDGTEIGTVVVDDNGTWTVDVPDGVNLAAGDTISVVQNDNYGDQSEPASTTVLPGEVAKPTINAPKAGEKTITGTGVPGDTVTVMTEEGVEIGSAVVDSDGNWTVNVPDDISLIEGYYIYAAQIDPNGNQSKYVGTVIRPAHSR
ncbi:Ig-like domain-containing protein [Pediococcus pentosaceus]|uniref:Ig-like domain-containing protein n=1 Tax=Pediococcus pentosaceus TaxID=1255 RepID=UPI0020BD9468|nr:Ig-like domain-containing protein [Pediococcus pentosaceus]MDQ7253377.1 Ig-like domain-containing protein [Pediococcus pentosaceus]